MLRRITSAFLAFLLLFNAASAQLSTIGVGGGFGGAASTPFSISYVGSNSTVASQTTFSFAAQGLGSADPTRITVVGVSGGAANLNVSGITIDGNAMTCPAGATQSNTVGMVSAMCYLAWPTGTTGTIAVTFAGTQTRCVIEVYSVLGSTTTFSVADGAISTVSSSSISKSVTIPTGGKAIGLVGGHITGLTYTGTNLTLDGADLSAGSSTTRTGVSAAGSGAAVSVGMSYTGNSPDTVLSILVFAP